MPIDCSLGEALRLFEQHLQQAGVSPEARRHYQTALHGPFARIILASLPEQRRALPLESLLLSQIPRPLIHDCMHSLRPSCFRIVRRLFTFLIHAGLLDPALLPTRSTVLAEAIRHAPTHVDSGTSLQQARATFLKHLSTMAGKLAAGVLRLSTAAPPAVSPSDRSSQLDASAARPSRTADLAQ